MKLDFYTWPPREKSNIDEVMPDVMEPAQLSTGQEEAKNYIPHPDLQAAMNLALALGKPLLVTGEPGTGKTRLAESVQWQLNIKNLFKFVAKSTSTARDLLYNYDVVGRFYAAESAGQAARLGLPIAARSRDPANAMSFITYAALGKAILCAHEQASVADFLSPGFHHPGRPERSVVLIDEIDKASRDFPNDLLTEIDLLQFNVPEALDRPTPEFVNRSLRPIVIITSNQEKNLPEPFLRRCIYFNIPFPEPHGGLESYSIENIVSQRLGEAGQFPIRSVLFQDAIAFFVYIRALKPSLEKRPATAELIDWIEALRIVEVAPAKRLADQFSVAERTIYALFKGQKDQKRGKEALLEWLKTQV